MDLETTKIPLKYFYIRKLIHFLFGIISIIALLFIPQITPYLLTLIAVLFIVFDLWRRREGEWQKLFYGTFGKMLKVSENKGRITGATTFLMTVASLPFLFPQDVAVASILVLSISDPLASVAGTLYPLKKIRKEKSLTGSGVFFLSGLSIFIFLVPGSLPYLLIAALLTTLIELLAPEVIENIAIGFSVAFMIAPLI